MSTVKFLVLNANEEYANVAEKGILYNQVAVTVCWLSKTVNIQAIQMNMYADHVLKARSKHVDAVIQVATGIFQKIAKTRKVYTTLAACFHTEVECCSRVALKLLNSYCLYPLS